MQNVVDIADILIGNLPERYGTIQRHFVASANADIHKGESPIDVDDFAVIDLTDLQLIKAENGG